MVCERNAEGERNEKGGKEMNERESKYSEQRMVLGAKECTKA